MFSRSFVEINDFSRYHHCCKDYGVDIYTYHPWLLKRKAAYIYVTGLRRVDVSTSELDWPTTCLRQHIEREGSVAGLATLSRDLGAWSVLQQWKEWSFSSYHRSKYVHSSLSRRQYRLQYQVLETSKSLMWSWLCNCRSYGHYWLLNQEFMLCSSTLQVDVLRPRKMLTCCKNVNRNWQLGHLL